MKTHSTKLLSIVTSPLLLMSLVACVTEPHNGQSICPEYQFEVQGFAENASAMIRVQAYNDDTSAWEVVSTTTSSSVGFTIEDVTLYSYATPVTLGYQHFTPFTPDAYAQIRVEEAGGTLDYLVTYDYGGTACVADKIFNEDMNWLAAGWACRSNQSPIIHLICIG